MSEGFWRFWIFPHAVAGGGRTVAGGDMHFTTSQRSTEHPAILLRVVHFLFLLSAAGDVNNWWIHLKRSLLLFLLLNTKARLAQFSFPMIHLHEKSVCFYIILYDLTVLGRGSNHSWSFHQTQLGRLRLWWNSLVFVHSKIYYTKIKMSHCQFLPILCSPGLISWPL